MNLSSTEKFINKAASLHGNVYSYDQVLYERAQNPVKIVCEKHGVFEQTPKLHLMKVGCPSCRQEKTKETSGLTLDFRFSNFLQKSKEAHGEKYDYSKVEYVNNHVKVKIVCKEHGEFSQSPHNHAYNKRGCPECGLKKAIMAGSKTSKNRACTTEGFITKALNIHGEKYDYSKVNYSNNKTHITIVCRKHGDFIQRPDHHLSGKDCERCMRESQESKKIPAMDEFLSKCEVEKEKMFPECKMINMLRFDRFIAELNLCIEYDGEQHFRASSLFGGEEGFVANKKRDKVKTDFCKKNKINLLRIKYNQDPVEELKKMLSVITKDKCIHLIYGKLKEIE